MFQRPPVVRGVKTRMVAACLNKENNEELIAELAGKANMTDFLPAINHGFSGGEIKRSELLQLSAQSPAWCFWMSRNRGLTSKTYLIGSLINDLLGKYTFHERINSGLIIPIPNILNYVNAAPVMLCDGYIICEANAGHAKHH